MSTTELKQAEPIGFSEQLLAYQQSVENNLACYFGANDESWSSLIPVQASLYSLMAGGKRIRPVLILAVAELLGLEKSQAMPFAAALEMIHTYSLIHDDLPCMDNDDMRRGKPTCHVKFNEAYALLAGDALLNRAYEVIFKATVDGASAKAGALIAQMAGFKGMIGGQSLDLWAENQKIDETTLLRLHRLKTGCLLKAAILTPVILANKGEDQVYTILEKFADHLGLAFQIKDDILDVVSTKETLGKSIGKDQDSNKSTFVTLYGLEKAKLFLQWEITSAEDALEQLSQLGYNTAFLRDLNSYLLHRDK